MMVPLRICFFPSLLTHHFCLFNFFIIVDLKLSSHIDECNINDFYTHHFLTPLPISMCPSPPPLPPSLLPMSHCHFQINTQLGDAISSWNHHFIHWNSPSARTEIIVDGIQMEKCPIDPGQSLVFQREARRLANIGSPTSPYISLPSPKSWAGEKCWPPRNPGQGNVGGCSTSATRHGWSQKLSLSCFCLVDHKESEWQ